MTLSLTPLLSLLAGVLILIMPRQLRYVVAAHSTGMGLPGLFGNTAFRNRGGRANTLFRISRYARHRTEVTQQFA